MNKDIKERARHKAFAKISFSIILVIVLQRCLSSNKNELLTWQYIAKLIETDE